MSVSKMAAAWPSGSSAPEAATARLLGVLWFVSVTTGPWGAVATSAGGEELPKCEDLKVGQYICKDPKINDATQEPVNCTNYTAHGKTSRNMSLKTILKTLFHRSMYDH